MSSVTWTCPRCGRRVPNRAPACHCGMTQEQTREQPAAPGPAPRTRPRGPGLPWREIWKDLTWDLKAMAIGVVLVAILGLAWLFVPHKPEPIVPVLGIVVPAPSPSPTSTTTPKPKGP